MKDAKPGRTIVREQYVFTAVNLRGTDRIAVPQLGWLRFMLGRKSLVQEAIRLTPSVSDYVRVRECG